MALIVEDGTGLATADSYASIVDLEAELAKLGKALTTTDADAKDALAREATSFIEAHFRFPGRIKLETQALLFPRYDHVDRAGRLLSSSAIPADLVRAQALLMKQAESGALDPQPAQSQEVESFTKRVGPITRSYSYRAGSDRPRYPEVECILAKINGYRIDSGGALRASRG